MREIKKHWNDGTRQRTRNGIYIKQRSLCGREFMFGGFANAKRKVTCKNCQRVMGLHNKSTGEKK